MLYKLLKIQTLVQGSTTDYIFSDKSSDSQIPLGTSRKVGSALDSIVTNTKYQPQPI